MIAIAKTGFDPPTASCIAGALTTVLPQPCIGIGTLLSDIPHTYYIQYIKIHPCYTDTLCYKSLYIRDQHSALCIPCKFHSITTKFDGVMTEIDGFAPPGFELCTAV